MPSHKRFDSDAEEDIVKKEKKREKKEKDKDDEDDGMETMAIRKVKKDKKNKRDRETEADEKDVEEEKKKKKRGDEESHDRHKEKKPKERKREDEFELREDKNRDRPKDNRSDRDNWRKNDWNTNDNRGGQWKRDRDARQDRGDRGDWGRNDNRNNFRRNDRKRPDPRDNDPSKPAWATGAVMDRAEELKQRKLLWKKPSEGEEASSSTAIEEKHVEKNAGMWSAAFTAASGGNSAQSSKFMKLMGIKSAPAAATDNMDDKRMKEEQAKQKALMAGLERQYEVSREFSHQGRGKGLGFGGY